MWLCAVLGCQLAHPAEPILPKLGFAVLGVGGIVATLIGLAPGAPQLGHVGRAMQPTRWGMHWGCSPGGSVAAVAKNGNLVSPLARFGGGRHRSGPPL